MHYTPTMLHRAVARVALVVSPLAAAGCGGGASSSPRADAAAGGAHGDAAARVDAARDAHAGLDAARSSDAAPGACHASPLPADRIRKVVVSHPFNAQQNAASDFEVFELDASGAITQPNVHFTLGPTTDGRIAFTPDGAIGLVAEDDGSLGVFRFDASGAPVVVAAAQTGSYSATRVVMDPSGARAFILDDQTENNGGGIYSVAIACDGTLTDEGLLASARLPVTVLPIDGGEAVIVAKGVLGVPPPEDAGADGAATPGNDAVLVAWPQPAKVLATADPFGDDNAIVSDATLTSDGRFVLLGDNSSFSATPNRVGVLALRGGAMTAAGVVANVNDPESLVASPFDETVLATSAFGNALFVLQPSADAGPAPFVLRGPVAYAGPAPQLPGQAVMIGRGALRGRVLIAENLAIRQVQFAAGGAVTDLGPTSAGDPNAFTTIVGCIGVQP